MRIPYDGIASEVWVADNVDGDEARTLIRGFLKARKESGTESAIPMQSAMRRTAQRPTTELRRYAKLTLIA